MNQILFLFFLNLKPVPPPSFLEKDLESGLEGEEDAADKGVKPKVSFSFFYFLFITSIPMLLRCSESLLLPDSFMFFVSQSFL